jgi:uncharacterized damage-inducible protein DinB
MATGLAGHFVAHFVAMARNNAWANHRLLKACEALTPEEFAAPRTSFFPSLRKTLNHILDVDLYYIDALQGLDALRHYSEPDSDYADARSLRLVQTESDRCLIAFCERQTETTLSQGIVLPRPNRTPPPTSVASVLEHLFQHDIHHRGQAHAMLAGTAVKPPQLDEFFLAGELALRRDELRELGLPEV